MTHWTVEHYSRNSLPPQPFFHLEFVTKLLMNFHRKHFDAISRLNIEYTLQFVFWININTWVFFPSFSSYFYTPLQRASFNNFFFRSYYSFELVFQENPSKSTPISRLSVELPVTNNFDSSVILICYAPVAVEYHIFLGNNSHWVTSMLNLTLGICVNFRNRPSWRVCRIDTHKPRQLVMIPHKWWVINQIYLLSILH